MEGVDRIAYYESTEKTWFFIVYAMDSSYVLRTAEGEKLAGEAG
jgi:hypothetical protein